MFSRRDVLSMAAAQAAAPLPALASSTGVSRVVYDPRFPKARRLAQGMSGGGSAVAIAADPTILTGWSLGTGDVLRGVTPEAAPFCLGQVLGSRARLNLTRLDRDLFAWSITMAAD